MENVPPSSEPEEEDDNEGKSLMKEWENYMHDFVPADLLTYEISPIEQEVIFLFFNDG